MLELAQQIRQLAREAWLESQDGPLSDVARHDISCALSDLDTLLRADADSKSELTERAA